MSITTKSPSGPTSIAKNGLGPYANPTGTPSREGSNGVLRELSREEAACEVVAYLKANGRTDSFDLALALDLDPEFVESLCSDLARDGQIADA